MSHFLKSLVARSLGAVPVLQPRLPALFEPAGAEQIALHDGPNRADPREPDFVPAPVVPKSQNQVAEPPANSPVRKQGTQRRVPENKRSIPIQEEQATNAVAIPVKTVTAVNPEANFAGPDHGRKNKSAKELKQESAGEFSKRDTKPARPIADALPPARLSRGDKSAPHASMAPLDAVAESSARALHDQIIDESPVTSTEALATGHSISAAVGKNTEMIHAIAKIDQSTSAALGVPLAAEPIRPVIHVSIGRIEVQAITPSVSVPQARPRQESKSPVLGLGDYLKERQQGGRR